MRYNPPRRRKKTIEFECLSCGKFGFCYKTKRDGIRKYCSNSCQQDYEYRTITVPLVLAGKGEIRALRTYLINTRGYKCEICSLYEWMDKPITLQVDHIDGNSDYNFPKNIRLLCPNCHSQTATWTGRNKKNSKRQMYMKKWSNKVHGPDGTALPLHGEIDKVRFLDGLPF